jgi:hypothetical protein
VANGSGSHTFALRTSNLSVADGSKSVVLKPGNAQRLTWTGTIETPNSPWFVVVVPDGDVTRRREASLGAVR